jgi:hypothetical protein
MEKLIDDLFNEDDFDQLNTKWHSNYRNTWISLLDQYDDQKKVEALLKLVEYFVDRSNFVEKFFYPNIKISESEDIQNNLFYIIKSFFEEIVIENLTAVQKFDLLEKLLQSRLKFFLGLAFGHLIFDINTYRSYEKFSIDECNRFNKIFEIRIFPLFDNSIEISNSEEMKTHIDRYCDMWRMIFGVFFFEGDQFLNNITSIQHLYELVLFLYFPLLIHDF